MKDFFNVITIDAALACAGRFHPVETETTPIADALDRVMAQSVVAGEDLPPFARSTMDGYAVAAASTFGASESSPAFMTVTGSVAMGQAPRMRLSPGQAARISTGGMLPEGADAVVMVEHTAVLDESTIEVYKSAAPGLYVIEAGEDVRKASQVIAAGTRLRPQEIGLMAALGIETVPVYRRPRIAIISTGDEIVPPKTVPGPGKLRDVNSHTLAGQCRAAGADPVLYGIIPDQYDMLYDVLSRAVSASDMVLLSGGSSVGVRDFTLEAISHLPEARILAHGISISPGKPTIIAECGGKPVLGLPGHVTSAMVVFAVIVAPMVRRIAGASETDGRIPAVMARITRNLASAQGRDDFVRVRLVPSGDGYLAEPILGKSGLISTMVSADGLVRVPGNVEGLTKGSPVAVMPLI